MLVAYTVRFVMNGTIARDPGWVRSVANLGSLNTASLLFFVARCLRLTRASGDIDKSASFHTYSAMMMQTGYNLPLNWVRCGIRERCLRLIICF